MDQAFILTQMPTSTLTQPLLATLPLPDPPLEANPHPAHINLAVGITIGLLASFIQSLGLTIQRKSHLQNDLLPFHLRKPDYARPVWLIGFVIYFTFNILGSVFQIGTLPLIILGPLGAISLLWNAILAKILLGDRFSYHLVFGTLLIGAGAVLIGVFGVLPDNSNHNLSELIILYSRAPFVVEIVILIFTFSVICLIAHFAEFRLNTNLRALALTNAKASEELNYTPTHQPHRKTFLDENSSQRSSCHSHHPIHGMLLSHRPQDASRRRTRRPRSLSTPAPLSRPASVIQPAPLTGCRMVTSPYSAGQSSPDAYEPQDVFSSEFGRSVLDKTQSRDPCTILPTPQAIARTKMLIGIAYGSTSGTLSGICLLFAKTGVELLILTLTGSENQFANYGTWLILAILLVSAILQLWYLNKALRLVNPTLICPLAFCFYNLSSIISSLVYYDQLKLLSSLQTGLIILGTAVLLIGVWIVSIGTSAATPPSSTTAPSSCMEEEVQTQGPIDEATPLLVDCADFSSSPVPQSARQEEDARSAAVRELKRQMSLPSHRRHHPTVDQLIRRFLAEGEVRPVRGFSIGLGAASPG